MVERPEAALGSELTDSQPVGSQWTREWRYGGSCGGGATLRLTSAARAAEVGGVGRVRRGGVGVEGTSSACRCHRRH